MNVKEALELCEQKLSYLYMPYRTEDQHAACVLSEEVRRLQRQLERSQNRVIELETKLSNIEIAQFNNGIYI